MGKYNDQGLGLEMLVIPIVLTPTCKKGGHTKFESIITAKIAGN